MENTIKELTPKVNKSMFCKHADGHYSLNIDLSDTHVSLSSGCYDHINGNHFSIWIDLSPEQMIELSETIKQTALDIQYPKIEQ